MPQARPSPTFSQLRDPIVDPKTGMLTRGMLKKFNEWEQKLNAIATLAGQLNAQVSLQGKTATLADTTQNLGDDGKFDSLDNVNDGVVHGRTLQTALTANQVDLSKVGVVGQVASGKIANLAVINGKIADQAVGSTKIADQAVGSPKIVQNVMYNYSNNATVDSIDNGVNATIRVYGPGGVGTTWHQFIGAVVGPEIPAFSGAFAYSTDFFVYYDGSYHVTLVGSDTLPDGILFSGSLHTVAAGGAGGSGGGGGAGGGGGGNQRK